MVDNTQSPRDANPDPGMESLSPATLAVWGGEGDSLVQGATQVPVVYSAAYGYPDVDTWLDVALGRKPGHIYSRNTNPTVRAFEEKVRVLEGAEAATSFATGMAAVSNTLFALLSPGDRVVSVKDTYGGTNKLFLDFLPRFGIEVELCDTTDHEQIEAAIAQGCTLALPGDARRTRRSRSWTSRDWPPPRTTAGATRGRRQHVRHAHQPESAGAGRRPGDPQRDQVPRRPCRRARRRGVRRSASWSSGSSTTARSPARRSTPWRPTCSFAA